MKRIILLTFLIVAAFLVACTPAPEGIPYEQEQPDVDPASACESEGGEYLPNSNECVGVSQVSCEDQLYGLFDACASACRNDPDAEACTRQCVPVCYLPGLL